MSNCTEVLFVSESVGQFSTVSCYDPHIGTTLMCYKGGRVAQKNTLALIGNDYVISAEADKPLLHVWPLNSQEPGSNKRVVSGKVSALTTSPDGFYCVAGIDAKIYIWQISSGSLLNVVSQHYQDITKIKFSNDSTYFVTGGKDGSVLVWRLADVIVKQSGSSFKALSASNQPVYNFTHHSLPVTDLFLGYGDRNSRLYTTSVDHTCKIYSLVDGSMLLSIVFDEVLTSIALNVLETELFVGMNRGKIQIFSLDPYPRTLDYHVEESSSNCLMGHKSGVSCLSISIDGRSLASGSEDGKVIIWDIPTRQMLKTFELKGAITNLFFSLASKNIFSDNFQPHLVVGHFQRASHPDKSDFEINVTAYEETVPIFHGNNFELLSGVMQNSGESTDVVYSLTEENKKLREINNELYRFAMDKVLNQAGVFEKDNRPVKQSKKRKINGH